MLDLGDAYVLAKPAGWVVDARPPGATPVARKERSLVAFLQLACGKWAPILRDDLHRHGLLHRLDANSSGLVLGALTFSRYYMLHMLLDSQLIDREYVVLLHGWVSPNVVLVNARVRRGLLPGSASSLAVDGKPAMTRLKVLAHLRCGVPVGSGNALTLAAVRIITGRTHQIRAHMAYIGHPVVCDAKYTSRQTHGEDLRVHCHHFLHRYRVALAGRVATQVLPQALAATLARLVPVGAASEVAIGQWLRRSNPPSYAALERLPGASGSVAAEAPWPPSGSGLAWAPQEL